MNLTHPSLKYVRIARAPSSREAALYMQQVMLRESARARLGT